MKATEFIEQCATNFTLDVEALTITTPEARELTESGCGWDVGRDWYSYVPASQLVAEVDRCLRESIDTSRIAVEGKEVEYRVELDGPCGGRISNSGTERPIKAELEIDITNKRITIHSA